VLKAESKIKTMNKLTTKENIEKAAEEYILNSYENSVSVKKMTIGFANRVLEDMQEVQNAKFNLWEINAEIDELKSKLTTTRADTLKEVLGIVQKEFRDTGYNESEISAFKLVAALIQQLLNQKT
jgi:hypothetical protein